MTMYLESWEQPELHDCDLSEHDYELEEVIERGGYAGTNKWICTECGDVYSGESE